MSQKTTFFKLTVLIAVLSLSFLKPAHAAEQGPSPEQIQKIAAASPSQPRVQPAKPRKLLVFSRSIGYYHTAIPFGKKALEIMGQKTGAFEATITDDPSAFDPQNLRQFDAVFFNNTNEEVFLPEDFDKLSADQRQNAEQKDKARKKTLADFIASGKGFAAIHAASNALVQWPEYGNILGVRFDNHPWLTGSIVTLKIEQPDHPVAQAFKHKNFVVADEVYQLKEPYSRDNLRVLLSIDTSKTAVLLDHMNMVHRKDNDFAISFVKSYGRGRVFYCALGHDHDLYWNPVVLQHYLDGIQFVLGDLNADTTPSAKLQTTIAAKKNK